jgi:3-methyladenine DNA glycosylase AlkD
MPSPILTADEAHRQFVLLANPERAPLLQRYFKTGPGEYAEGDVFLGLKVPETRAFAKLCGGLPLSEIEKILRSRFHEERLLALFLLTRRFSKTSPAEQKAIYDLYVANFDAINNWDLVDSSAPYIVGPYLQNRDRRVLVRWAKSKNLWERRIAMLASGYYIRQKDFADTLRLAELLLNDKEDLIHKAVGWMLREIGNRDRAAEEAFLNRFATRMPRTMLRYAIEKLPPAKRKQYLARPKG